METLSVCKLSPEALEAHLQDGCGASARHLIRAHIAWLEAEVASEKRAAEALHNALRADLATAQRRIDELAQERDLRQKAEQDCGALAVARNEMAETISVLREGAAERSAEVERLRAKLADAEKDRDAFKATLDMYRNAWRRELGEFLAPKHHDIDALVVGTRNAVAKAREVRMDGQKALAERRAERAERALKRAGFEDHGGEEWVPPVLALDGTGHYTGCPKENGECTCAKRDAAPRCAGEPDCGWHNGGPCAACKAPPIIPTEDKIATFPGEFVSWHELTDRARHMFAYSKVVLTAQQVRALENDVAAFTNGASRPRMVGWAELLKDVPDRPACAHHVWGPDCPDCPGGKTVPAVPPLHATLSARDEFAKAAMQAAYVPASSDATRMEVAQRAYAMADAMLKARAPVQPQASDAVPDVKPTCGICNGTGKARSVDRWPNPTESKEVPCWCQEEAGE